MSYSYRWYQQPGLWLVLCFLCIIGLIVCYLFAFAAAATPTESLLGQPDAGDGCNWNLRAPDGRIIGMTTMNCDAKPTDGTLPLPREPVCLAQMEAAMRAMDHYLPRETFVSGYLQGVQDAATIMARGGAAPAGFDHQRLSETLRSVESQWADAKRECWREP